MFHRISVARLEQQSKSSCWLNVSLWRPSTDHCDCRGALNLQEAWLLWGLNSCCFVDAVVWIGFGLVRLLRRLLQTLCFELWVNGFFLCPLTLILQLRFQKSKLILTSPVGQRYGKGYPDNFELKNLTYKSVKPLRIPCQSQLIM
jgi:hypothetical protein